MINSMLKRVCFTVSFLFSSLLLFAQTEAGGTGTLDDTMRSHDKIYVVMAVCLIIITALFLYLIRIDVKISKKEKQL